MTTNDPRFCDARQLRRHARWRQRRHLAVASAMAVLNQASEALVPIMVGVAIDRAVVPGDGGALVVCLGVVLALYGVLSISHRFGQRRTHFGAVLVEEELRLRLLGRVLAPAGGAEARHRPGELVSIVSIDVWRIALVNYYVPLVVAAVVGVLIGGGALLAFSPLLGLLVLLGAPPLLVAIHLLGIPLQRRHADDQAEAATAATVAIDLFRGLRVLKGVGGEDEAVARYRTVSHRALLASLRVARVDAAYQGAVLALNGLFLAVVAYVAGMQATDGHLEVGQLVAAVGLAQFLLGPLSMFAEFSGAAAAGRASADRVAAVMAAPPAVAEGAGEHVARPGPRSSLEWRSVGAGPLEDVSFRVEPGEIVALVTGDPAGLEAVVRCLGRESDPEAGTVLLGGCSIVDLAPDDVRRSVVVAAHDGALFTDRVADLVGALSTDDATTARAVAAARVDDVVRLLPHGADTQIAERGRSLSGGQRQRIALARALGSDADILVLHEPTTGIDAVTERDIARGVADMRRGRTTLLLTTSAALLEVTDRVLLLDDGRIARAGRHQQLLVDDERYREIVLS